MKRRVAWFMALLMCVTSVPQSSFLSMAAEETEVSTEPMTLAASEEEALEVERVDETEAAVEETAPETIATEISVPETVIPEPVETETVVPEVMETERETLEAVETETIATETAVTEVSTEAITEAPETETNVPETVLPETESEETEEQETVVPETERETEEIAVLTGEGEEVTVTNTLAPGQTVELDFNGNDTVECQYSVPTSGKYCLKFSADSEIRVEVDGFSYGNTKEFERDCLLEAGTTYTFQVNKHQSDEADFPVYVSMNETPSIAALNITPGTLTYPKTNGDSWHFRDWQVQVEFTDGSASDPFGVLDMMYDDENSEWMNSYTSKYNIGVEIYKNGSNDVFANSEYEGDTPWELGDYQVVFTYPEGRTGRYDFRIVSWDDIYQEFPRETDQKLENGQYWKITIPEGEGGDYALRAQNSVINLYGEDDKIVGRNWGNTLDVYHLEDGKTYHFSPEYVADGAVGLLEKLDSWDMTAALERTRTNGYCVLTPAESGTYYFEYENDSESEGSSAFQIYDENGNGIESSPAQLTAGERYLLWFGFFSEDEVEGSGWLTASQTSNPAESEDLETDQTITLDKEVYYFKVTPEEAGYYLLKYTGEDEYPTIEVKQGEDSVSALISDCWLNDSCGGSVYWFDSETTYYVEARKTEDDQTLCLNSLNEKWDPETPLSCSEENGYAFYTFQVEEDGIYRFSSEEWNVDWQIYNKSTVFYNSSVELAAGQTYLLKLLITGEDVLTMERVPKITAIHSLDIKNKDRLLANSTLDGDSIELSVSYADGTTETVYGMSDGKENDFYGCFWDPKDEETTYDWDETLKAGTYTLKVYCSYGEEEVSATCDFTVRTAKDLTGENRVTKDESTRFVEAKDGQYVAFQYTATETGLWDVRFNKSIEKLIVEDEQGKQTTLYGHEYHYTVELEAGKTVYFIADAGENWRALRVKVTKGVAIAKVELSNERTYYIGISELDSWDFYLNVTYTDGSTAQFKANEVDNYGNHFSMYAVIDGQEHDLGEDILADRTEYEIRAYLGNEVKATMQLTCKEFNLNEFQALKVGQPVSWETNEQYYRFTPEKDGYYSLAGDYSYSMIYSRENNQWISIGEHAANLEKGTTYLFRVYGRRGEYVLLADETPKESLTPEQPVAIAAGEECSFTFTPEKNLYYRLKTEKNSGGKIYLALYYKNGSEYRYLDSNVDELSFYLQKGMEYLVTALYEGGNGNASLTVTYPGSNKISGMTLWGDPAFSWGISGVDTLETVLGNFVLSVGFDNGTYTSYTRLPLSYYTDLLHDGGIFTDNYENQYTVSLKPATGKNYVFRVTSGTVSAETEIIFVDPNEVKALTEGSSEKISVPQADGIEKKEIFRFVPTTDGVYKFSTSADGDLNPYIKVRENDQEVGRDASYDGYHLEQGKTYLIVVSYSRYSTGTITVEASNVTEKAIIDVELEGELSDTYAVADVCYPDLEGTKLKFTYADGTTEIKTYTWDGEDEIEAIMSMITSKTCRIRFEAAGYCVEKEIPMLPKTEVPVLPREGMKNVQFSAQETTKAFSFTVGADGVYQPWITDEKGEVSYHFCRIQENVETQPEISEDGSGYQLKAGVTYYLIVKAKGSQNISIQSVDAVCEHQYEWVTKNATCTTAGSRTEICKLCGDVRKTEILPALGHELKTVIEKDATCGANGRKHVECSRGDYKEASVVIPATGKHTYTTKTDKAATCGAAGSQHRECTVCGYKEAATVINATGKHTYTTKVDKAATCGATGSQHEECTVCGDKKAATTIPATGNHSFGAYKTTVAATVLKAGTKERTCTVCGKKETASIAKLKATIKLSATKITVPLKKTIAGPTVTFGKGDAIKSWKSAKTSVVTVNSRTGKLTGKKAGTAKVTVTLKSGKKATVTVTVKKIITTTKLKANKTTVTLKKGKTFQLKVTVTPKNSQEKVTYKSSNTKVATVTSRGKITAKKAGKAVITITSGTKKISCKVTVK